MWAEYERIEREEMPMLDMILAARRETGLSHAQVAERMGTKASAVARLEASLVSGKHSPSLSTLICQSTGQTFGCSADVAPPCRQAS